MAKPQNADWNLAQALYLQGVAYSEIAVRVGVTPASLRKRASRHNWYHLRTSSLVAASQAVTGHAGKTLVQRSSDLKSTLADELTESANALRKTPVKASLTHLGERVEVSQKLVASADKLYGWKGEPQRGLILGELLSSDLIEVA